MQFCVRVWEDVGGGGGGEGSCLVNMHSHSVFGCHVDKILYHLPTYPAPVSFLTLDQTNIDRISPTLMQCNQPLFI